MSKRKHSPSPNNYPLPKKRTQSYKTLTTGPLTFTGTPNLSLGTMGSRRPVSTPKIQPKDKKEEFARFEWEELEREADRAWYDDEDTY